jgi:predicted nucleotidyltransferase
MKYMTLEELRRSKKDRILELASQYGAHNVRVFGSLARGEHGASSDIDFLVDLDPERTLMDLGGLLMELQDMLQARVDVATEEMLRPKARDQALRDALPL